MDRPARDNLRARLTTKATITTERVGKSVVYGCALCGQGGFTHDTIPHAADCPENPECVVTLPKGDLLALLDAADRAEALAEVLRRVEWSGSAWIDPDACPLCGGEQANGHKPGCALAAALEEVRRG